MLFAALCLHLAAGTTHDLIRYEIALVPIDSRPAAGQFPVKVAEIGGLAVSSPPPSILGQFTTAGKPDLIAQWLVSMDYSNTIAAVVSADMVCYGGLIESRVPKVSEQAALSRLECFVELRKKNSSLPIFVFSSLMRTAPTATNAAREWRMDLAKVQELTDRYRQTREAHLPAEIRKHRRNVPAGEMEKYEAARKRNMQIHKKLIRMVKDGVISYLIIGADDAQKYGPHVRETEQLKALANDLGIAGLVYFCEGVDQNAILLVSRAMLRRARLTPKVFVDFSNPDAGSRRMAFESKPLIDVVRDQIIASGARPTDSPDEANYKLFINVPDSYDERFERFRSRLTDTLENRGQAALVDIHFDQNGAGDPRLMETIGALPDFGALLGFAGWNTASNSIGTAVPHANMRLLASQMSDQTVRQAVAHREFLFHRYVGDYGYHRVIRPRAYRLIAALPGATREELTGEAFRVVENYVVRSTRSVIENYFSQLFLSKTLKAAKSEYRIVGISNINVSLPWPRVFETSVQFEFVAEEVKR